ncbi:MAG: hypothetical protein ACJAVL_000218 [Bacteroidia bacterium]|jgi:hypothetical protein
MLSLLATEPSTQTTAESFIPPLIKNRAPLLERRGSFWPIEACAKPRTKKKRRENALIGVEIFIRYVNFCRIDFL